MTIVSWEFESPSLHLFMRIKLLSSFPAQVAELVDAHVSGACAERREGSSPFLGTMIATLLLRNCRASESRNKSLLLVMPSAA